MDPLDELERLPIGYGSVLVAFALALLHAMSMPGSF
jgi:hypothetical protein